MIYLDNSATTRPSDAAIIAAREMMEGAFFNPSAMYRQAVEVEKRLRSARDVIGRQAGVSHADVTITGSGTEADALAIVGSAMRFRGNARVLFFGGEHAAVLKTEARLLAMGHTVEKVPATDEGIIDLLALEEMLDERVMLLSLMHVNNETGAIQPLAEASRLLHAKSPEAVFHVDGVQGFLRVPVDIGAQGIDLYSISAHKVHGPKGAGALLRGKRAKLAPLVEGGGQEAGLRAGTENTPGICGFAAAVEWIASQPEAIATIKQIKLAIYERLRAQIEGLRVNGPAPGSEAAAPHILNVSLPGVGGEVMLHALEEEGVLVGTGSACSSKKKAMSAAFAAMRAPAFAAESAIRISLGLMNAQEEAESAADAIVRCYEKYRPFQRR